MAMQKDYRKYKTAFISAALMIVIIGFFAEYVVAQDAPNYVMYETQYLTVKPGHFEALSEKLAEHNKRFHAEGPRTASVLYILNGARTGDLFWVMGPTTFADLDSRPKGEPHDGDWLNEVLAHCEKAYNTEYWVRNDELSYLPANMDQDARELSRARIFEVADNALFEKVQGQIKKVIEAMGSKQPRTMYRKRFMHRDGRDWAAVSRFKNWSEFDEEGASFEATFKNVHGDEAWNTFTKEFGEAVVSREDEWRQNVPEMDGAGNSDSDE